MKVQGGISTWSRLLSLHDIDRSEELQEILRGVSPKEDTRRAKPEASPQPQILYMAE
jgi:hypothetical protein